MIRHDNYDIVVVGAGISGAAFVEHTLELAGQRKIAPRIAVLESTGEFWRGIPYGQRSSEYSLTITSFKEFVPHAHHTDFALWLSSNKANWTGAIRASAESAGRRWLNRNASLIDQDRWDTVFLPRRLYGDFLASRIERAIARARYDMGLEVDLIPSRVRGIKKGPVSGYQVTLGPETGLPGKVTTLNTRIVVLAIGSPPVGRLPFAGGKPDGALIVEDIYQDGLDGVIRRVTSQLNAQPDKRNVLLIGSNASAMEFVYLAGQTPSLIGAMENLTCVSPSGRLPVSSEQQQRAGALPSLRALANRRRFSADDLFEAVMADSDGAWASGEFAGVVTELIEYMGRLLAMMTDDQQRLFHHHHGMNFTRIVRRSGGEYSNTARSLAESGLLNVVPGRLVTLIPSHTGKEICFTFTRQGAPSPLLFEREFTAVVNTAGFEGPGASSSSDLIRCLVDGGLCIVNPSRQGFLVNDEFEAAPGLYIAGPLLGGIFGERLRTWHLESARRIYAVSCDLAEVVVNRMSPKPSQLGLDPGPSALAYSPSARG